MNYYIHKYNKITGYWVMQRKCNDESINKWLEIYMQDEPDETFIKSHKSSVNKTLENLK